MTKILFYVSCFFMVNQNNIFNAKTGFFSLHKFNFISNHFNFQISFTKKMKKQTNKQ